jgi:two-component system chemotaxis response regulator CheY
MIVRRALRQAGFQLDQVLEASNGVEALSAIADQNPDVVLCDWNMPEMTGIELLESLNEQGIRTKLGFVTSEGTADIRERARVAGAAFFISKPISADKFVQAMGGLAE